MDVKTYQGGLCINRTVYIWCIQLFKVTIVRSQLPELDEVGRSKSCEGKRPPFHLCENIKETCTFKSKHLDEIHNINKNYNCNSKMAVYLIEGMW